MWNYRSIPNVTLLCTLIVTITHQKILEINNNHHPMHFQIYIFSLMRSRTMECLSCLIQADIKENMIFQTENRKMTMPRLVSHTQHSWRAEGSAFKPIRSVLWKSCSHEDISLRETDINYFEVKCQFLFIWKSDLIFNIDTA